MIELAKGTRGCRVRLRGCCVVASPETPVAMGSKIARRLSEHGPVEALPPAGDIPSGLAFVWARFLMRQPGRIAKPASLDVEADKVELAHCTIAPSMVQDLSLSSYFESGSGVGLHGRFQAGPITLIRIAGRDLDKVRPAEGQILDSHASAYRRRPQATVVLERGQVRHLLELPAGNHVVMVGDHHGDHLDQGWPVSLQSRRLLRTALPAAVTGSSSTK